MTIGPPAPEDAFEPTHSCQLIAVPLSVMLFVPVVRGAQVPLAAGRLGGFVPPVARPVEVPELLVPEELPLEFCEPLELSPDEFPAPLELPPFEEPALAEPLDPAELPLPPEPLDPPALPLALGVPLPLVAAGLPPASPKSGTSGPVAAWAQATKELSPTTPRTRCTALRRQIGNRNCLLVCSLVFESKFFMCPLALAAWPLPLFRRWVTLRVSQPPTLGGAWSFR